VRPKRWWRGGGGCAKKKKKKVKKKSKKKKKVRNRIPFFSSIVFAKRNHRKHPFLNKDISIKNETSQSSSQFYVIKHFGSQILKDKKKKKEQKKRKKKKKKKN
jgi:hypothetical protein